MKRNQNAIEEMQRLGKAVCDCQKQLKEAEHALEKYVREYMTEHDMWDNPEDIIAVIGCLPQGYFRFRMYERYYKIQEMQNEIQGQPFITEPEL